MSTGDGQALLHNMSAPPKTVVKYAGLADLTTVGSPGGSGVTGIKYGGNSVFGTPVRFVLPEGLSGKAAGDMLRFFSLDAEESGDVARLIALINQRATELPLPDGCVVIPSVKEHRVIWDDALAVLAILSKCSAAVWLRSKTPALAMAVRCQAVSLLVPPKFAAHLPEVPV